MSPEVDGILMQSFMKLAFELAPQLPPGYGQGSAATTGILLLMAAQEYERAAEVRAWENREMRALFGRAAAQAQGGLQSLLKDAAGSTDSGLAISTLNAANADLRKILIALQSWAETRPEAGALRKEIWAFLTEAARRRLIQLPAM